MKGKLITTDSSNIVNNTQFTVHDLIVKTSQLDSGSFEFRIYLGGNLRMKLHNSFVYGDEQPLNSIVQFGGYNFFSLPFYYGGLLFIWNAEIFVAFVVVDERNWQVDSKINREIMPTLKECASFGIIPWKLIKLTQEL